jgi:hypothetical protein
LDPAPSAMTQPGAADERHAAANPPSGDLTTTEAT